jgi:hypothetical protein
MAKSKEELSRIRSEVGKKGAARSAMTYERRRRLKELEPQLNQWIEDMAHGKISIEDIPEVCREYVIKLSDMMKVEIHKAEVIMESARALREWRERMGFEGEDE